MYVFGVDPLNIRPYNWLEVIRADDYDKVRLTTAVSRTCGASQENYIFFGVNYRELNANSANFFAVKRQYSTGFRCRYANFGYFETDAERALSAVVEAKAPYFITVAPDKQYPRPNIINTVSRRVAELIANDTRFALEFESPDGLLIYRPQTRPN